MARKIETIKQQMTTAWMADPAIRSLYKIEPTTPNDAFETIFAKVSIENIIFYIVAFAIHILERIFDTEKDALVEYVENMRPHTQPWYIKTLRAYQLGDILNRETGKYDTIDEEKQIIKYCSLRKKNDELYFLIAADSGGVPAAIDPGELPPIWHYAERVFDAGVRFSMFSNIADSYKCKLLINYDPLVLDGAGKRLDGTNNTPVEDAINGYFRSFPFDSEFSNMALTDAIQQVEGVRVAQLTMSAAKPNIVGSSYEDIISTYIAGAGYMLFSSVDSKIAYVV